MRELEFGLFRSAIDVFNGNAFCTKWQGKKVKCGNIPDNNVGRNLNCSSFESPS